MRVLIASVVAFTIGSATAAFAMAASPDPPPCHQTEPRKYVCVVNAPADTYHMQIRGNWPGNERHRGKHLVIDWMPTKPGG